MIILGTTVARSGSEEIGTVKRWASSGALLENENSILTSRSRIQSYALLNCHQ